MPIEEADRVRELAVELIACIEGNASFAPTLAALTAEVYRVEPNRMKRARVCAAWGCDNEKAHGSLGCIEHPPDAGFPDVPPEQRIAKPQTPPSHQ